MTHMTDQERITALEARIAILDARVACLEARQVAPQFPWGVPTQPWVGDDILRRPGTWLSDTTCAK